MKQTLARILPYLALVVAAVLIFGQLGRSGIWDPWELNAADAARALADGSGNMAELRDPPLGVWLRAQSFAAFGVSEYAGRLPGAFSALLLVGLIFGFAAWFFGLRVAGLSATVAATTPLLLLNARQMLGEGVAMAGTTALGLATAFALFEPRGKERARPDARWLALRVVPFVAAYFFAMQSAGGLQGMLPPLAAGVITVVFLEGCPTQIFRRGAWAMTVSMGSLTILFVVRAVIADEAAYSAWLGGAPFGGEPPTFEQGIERLFHGFAPWSGLILPAFALVLATTRTSGEGVDLVTGAKKTDEGSDGEGSAVETADGVEVEVESDTHYPEGLPAFLVLWAGLAYGSLTVFEARYGTSTYLAIAPLALLIGMAIDQVARRKTSAWSEAILGAIFVALALRDFALYPVSPVTGLPIEGLEVPDVFNPRRAWAGVLGTFLAFLVLAFGARPHATFPDPRRAPRWLKAKLRESWAARAWTVLASLAIMGMIAFGVFAWIVGTDGEPPRLGGLAITSTGIRIGKALFFAPPALALAAYLAAVALWFVGRFDYGRILLVPIGGVVVAGYIAFSFQPALANHFSPRAIYDSYNELRSEGEPLAEFHVSGRAAAYYADGEIEELAAQNELLDYLSRRDQRTWAIIPADELANLNRAYRQRNQRHLYVADASSARVLLVTSEPIEGRENQNFIAETVLDEVPAVQHPVGAVFDERIELVGYNLELPGGDFVGPGQQFAITWVWRARRRVPGSYKIFLHIDGSGQRIHGDHDPVGERYPVRLWDEGDVILDRQEIRVPPTNRPGIYHFMIGFFAGNNRLPVTEGDADDANRINAGRLVVR